MDHHVFMTKTLSNFLIWLDNATLHAKSEVRDWEYYKHYILTENKYYLQL